MTPLHRRQVLRYGLAGLAGAALPRAAFGQGAPADLRLEPLSDNLILARGAGANVVAGVDGRGLLMVDGGLVEHSDALLAALRRETGEGRVHTLVNTHWHPEHTGANRTLGEAGATIIAHENTRLWLTATISPPYEDWTHAPLPQAALPNSTVYEAGSAPFAGGTMQYGYLLQAHTDGDLYVHFPEEDVLVAGGVAASDRWPYIDWWTGGWIGAGGRTEANTVLIPTYGGMVGGLQELYQLAGEDTKIVPAHGPVMRRADLRAQIELYAPIADAMREMLFQARGPQDVVAADLTGGAHPEWGAPDRFLTLAYKSLNPHLTPDA